MTDTPHADGAIDTIALSTCTDTLHRIRFPEGSGLASWSLAELDRRAARVARHLHALGLRARDRIGVMARNRIEWVVLDLAVLKLGAVTAGFEAGRFDPAQIVEIYDLRALFTEDIDSAGALFDIADVARWGEDASTDGAQGALHAGYDPADICAIKFTSGSTGVPKGLEATVASVERSLDEVQRLFAHSDGDDVLVFLRLALLQQRYWVYSALVNGHDVTISDLDNAAATAQAAAPTVVMGVPGFYEALRARLLERHAGLEADPAARGRAIQTELGGRVRYLWTGSAPCSPAVLEFFNEAGVPLYEGYGLNETCIVAKNHPGAFRRGSVGQVLPNKTVRFDKDGILIVGSTSPVNCRYTWCGEGVNAKTFLPTAEVKTWDLGHLDADGFLYIHGRADDVLSLSSGRNVLVRPIEEALREHPGVHEVVLAGNGQPFLSAVVSPEPTAKAIDVEALLRYMVVLNDRLLPEQRVHALVIADERFSLENDLLTSQFKPRRKDIHARYAEALARLYQLAGPRVPAPGRVPVVVRDVGESMPPPHPAARSD
ncbi:MAG: AMP-binding protein [Ramlibacter sp.]|nr:AMP-binding protein [Ramlibacter sp.]